MARAAVGTPDPLPDMTPARGVEGRILSDACRWYALASAFARRSASERTEIVCEVVDQGRLRDFFGFNRGKHAVVEAAILATRTEFLPAEEMFAQFARLASAGRKDRRTGRASGL